MILYKYLPLIPIGLGVSLITYIVSQGRLKWSDIMIIGLSAMILVAITDTLKILKVQEYFSDKQIKPPGGLRSEILPLAMQNAKTLSDSDCHQINNYLDINPLEKINDKYLSSIYKFCEKKINDCKKINKCQKSVKKNLSNTPNKCPSKKVQFNKRVQTISDDGEIDSQSLISLNSI